MRRLIWVGSLTIFSLLIVLNIVTGTGRAAAQFNKIEDPNRSAVSAVGGTPSVFNLNAQIDTNQVSTFYVANTFNDCLAHSIPISNCFPNTPDVDGPDGMGTGLREAVLAADIGDVIVILGNYTIKDNTVLVNKEITLTGEGSAAITYQGSNCTNPMLRITKGVTLSGLSINDGQCSNPNRDLLIIDSDENVIVEYNTFQGGKDAIQITNNSGIITIRFNHITDNSGYALLADSATNGGEISLFANNIFFNRLETQVNCENRGPANHNFWGQGVSINEAVENCTITEGQRLGAPILLWPSGIGVQGVQQLVTTTTAYHFNSQIGVRRTHGKDYELVIVNHGQGGPENIPFRDSGAGTLHACSSYYDVFIAEGHVAENLILSIKYNLNNNCTKMVESKDFCGGGSSDAYPLYWYDPASNATDGWNQTGRPPTGPGSGGAGGQTTTCHTDAKEIRVVIDNTGRPGISADLEFTPFVIGVPIMFSDLSATYSENRINLRWVTSSEHKVGGFYVQRSEAANGNFNRIHQKIEAFGGPFVGGIYTFTDSSIVMNKNYYYRIEVVDLADNTIYHHGPITILTSTPTPTATRTSAATQTNTPVPTRTPTRFIYRTPTTYFRRSTQVINGGGPMPVRTFGPTPTGTRTFLPHDLDPESGYPIDENQTDPTSGYPPPEEEVVSTATLTPTPPADVSETSTPEETLPPGVTDEETSEETPQIRSLFFWVGIAAGLSLLGTASFILARIKFF